MTQPAQSTLSRKWVCEIHTGSNPLAPVWTLIRGLAEFTAKEAEGNFEDDNVYEDNGYTGQTKTALNWSAAGKVMRRTLASDVTTYDVGQEKLRTLAKTLGSTGVGYFRIYDRDGGPEAWTGWGEIKWDPDGGSPTDLEAVSFELMGKGAPTTITNPNAPALALPTVTALSPATGGAAGGTLVKITGDNFKDRFGVTVVSGASGVTFGGTNATAYQVDDRQTIYAIAPAHAAGSVQVVVTNTTGASPNTTADDYVYV